LRDYLRWYWGRLLVGVPLALVVLGIVWVLRHGFGIDVDLGRIANLHVRLMFLVVLAAWIGARGVVVVAKEIFLNLTSRRR
jgi:hypothetical protein